MQFWIFLIGIGLAVAQSTQRYGVGSYPLSQGRGGSGRNPERLYRGDNKVEPNPCGPGKLPNAIGECVEPIVNRNFFVYAAPPLPPVNPGPLPEIPNPIIDYNVVFVRTPEPHEELDPIVVPPPQKKTLVYVLTETGEIEQRVIEVPTEPSPKPEVIYVNYAEGDNPTLGDDVTLQDVLSQDAKEGQLFEATHNRDRSGGPRQSLPFSAPIQQTYGPPRPNVQTGLRPTRVLGQQRTRPSSLTSNYRAPEQRQLVSRVLKPSIRTPETIGAVHGSEKIARFTQLQYLSGENQPSHQLETISTTKLRN